MKINRTSYVIAIIFSLSLVLTLINYIWIKNNISHVPPLWDSAAYITMGLNDYDALWNNGPAAFIKTFITQDPYHAPLSPAIGMPFFIIFGTEINVIYYANAIYLFILMSSVFFIAKRLAGGQAGILAAFFAATFPVVIAYSRDYLFEFPLAAFTALTYLFFLRSDSFTSRTNSLLFGLFAGLSILTKTMGIIFFVMPFAYALYASLTSPDSKTVIKNAIFSFLAALFVASLFYVPNLKDIFWYLLHFGYGEGSKDYNLGISAFLSVDYWMYYLKAIAWRGISAGYTLVFIISALAYLFTKDKRPSRDYLLVWLWFIFGYLLLSAAPNKSGERFALPIFAPVAILMAVHTAKLSLKPVKYFIIALSVIAGLLSYTYQSMSDSCNYKEVFYQNIPVLLPLHVTCSVKDTEGLAVPYNKDWDIMPILQYMDSKNQSDSKPVNVLIAFEHHFLNGCTIQLFSKLGRLKGMLHSNFIVEGLFNKSPREDEIKGLIKKSDFIITKTGFQGPGFANKNNGIIENLLKNETPVKSFVMNDGSNVSLYSLPNPIRDLICGSCEIYEKFPGNIVKPVEVNYGNKVKFLGINADKLSQNRLKISYYWQAIDDLGPFYRAFVIFSDKDDKQLFGNDHDFCEKRPFSQIKGKFIKETCFVDIPPSAIGKRISIGVGIFSPDLKPEDARMKIISAGKSSVTDNNTRAIVEEINL